MPKLFYLYCLDFSNGKKYIGLTMAPAKRLYAHSLAARAGTLPIHSAFRKHGQPQMRLLCAGSKTYIAELEIKAIAAFRTREQLFGYNVSLGGELSPSLVPELATRAGLTKRGRPHSAIHRARIAAANTGRTHTSETRAKLRAALMARPNPMIGRKHSPEARAKMSAARMGRPNPQKGIPTGRPGPNKGKSPSAETRAKISAAGLGRKASIETRAKLSAAHMGNTNAKGSKGGVGRIVSAETREKIRAANIRRKQLKRAIHVSSNRSENE